MLVWTANLESHLARGSSGLQHGSGDAVIRRKEKQRSRADIIAIVQHSVLLQDFVTQASDESPVQSRSGFSPDKPIPEILATDGSPPRLPKMLHVSKDPGWIFRPKHVLFPTP